MSTKKSTSSSPGQPTSATGVPASVDPAVQSKAVKARIRKTASKPASRTAPPVPPTPVVERTGQESRKKEIAAKPPESAARKMDIPDEGGVKPAKSGLTAKQAKAALARDKSAKAKEKKLALTSEKVLKAREKSALKKEKKALAATEKVAKQAVAKRARKAIENARKQTQKQSRKQNRKKSKIEFDGRMPREEAVAYFEALVAGLKSGLVQFKQGKETIVVNPSETVDVDIRARTRGREESVTFELSWIAEPSSSFSVTSE